MIKLSNMSLRRGALLLFDEADVSIFPGQKVGLTGANGTGKSSLFTLFRGQLQPDSGSCELPKNWQLAHVKQETPALECSALDYVLDGDAHYREIEQSIAEATASEQHEQLGELYAQMEHIGGFSAPARASQMLHGLGFSADEVNNPVESFSGGWRMRLNLAQALMCRSDLLLLDEPTNHLDLEAVVWLIDWLKQYQGTLLVIAHDRDFLDAVVNHILHIEHNQLTLYSGNYSDFEVIRAERLAAQQAQHEKQQQVMAHMHSYVERFRYKASKAKQAQSRLKALERMEKVAAVQSDNPFSFRFFPCQNLAHQVVSLNRADIGYGDHLIFEGLDFAIAAGDRIGLLGRNGAGKSTLIKALAGEKALAGGERITAKDLSIGYFAQHQLEQLDKDSSALNHLQAVDNNATTQDLLNFLGGFGFRGERADCAIAPFSGGEKARLALSLIVYQRPDLLLLDEPTNHLDLNMREAISLALQDYQGAVILVSHDQHLIDSVVDDLWYVHAGDVHHFAGDLQAYQKHIKAELRAHDNDKTSATKNTAETGSSQGQAHQANRKQLKAQRNRLQKLDKQLQLLTQKKKQLADELNDEGLYQADQTDKLQHLLAASKANQSQLDEVEAEWLELAEQLGE
ncbi:ATP-binding cassette domain-containing protein [Marinicella gelatinilytica]|uniref:ATP-binding cassette domain-containing protein n=1 Tax=Marinicella gelatinilytica TaxID=2996017 RepID=UPI002260B71E|nr:ATP-binding cassette domain-containing protein [Marinicella gelatinilytica]MCX7545843.1 ATP-binding cassette domain-containing protein [Marinicella gelatinilytica]